MVGQPNLGHPRPDHQKFVGHWHKYGDFAGRAARDTCAPYEAARIDGASKWHEFRNITLPMLSPVLLFVLIVSTIASLQIFTDVRVMTQGGPGTATYVFVYFIYQTAFEYLKMGYSSALAWILFMIIFVLTLLQLWASQRWVYYESEERT